MPTCGLDQTLTTALGILALLAGFWCWIEMVHDMEQRDARKDQGRPGPNDRRK